MKTAQPDSVRGEAISLEWLMDPHATAAFLGVHVLTLADWRCKGGQGPDYVKVGRCVRYRHSDLKSWLETRTRKGA
jgi:predicted DNA-binding transcriptional regulator AlpA